MRTEGNGKLVALVLTAGQRHEATAFGALMEQGEVRPVGPGRPRSLPGRVVGDNGYSSRKIRQYNRRRGTGITISRRKDETRTGPFDRAIYRTQNRVEWMISRFKQFRRPATRYEKLADNYRAMWIIADSLLWL